MSDPIRTPTARGEQQGVAPPRPEGQGPLPPASSASPTVPVAVDAMRLSGLRAGSAASPLADVEPGRRLATGVWYADERRTRDGAPVRVLTVDPRQARLGAVYADGLQGMAPQSLYRHPQFVAAVNGTFFGAGVIGDMRGFGRTYLDEAAPLGATAQAADRASDQRHYVGVLRDGRVVTGRGGLAESGLAERLDSFQGGLGLLYDREQAARIEADIRSGDLARRLPFPPDQQEQSIARSFLGVTADGKVLLVAMGAGERRQDGAGCAEAARIMRALGAAEAYVLDGGGSTSMVVRGAAAARTDGRHVKNYLAVFARR
jgi:hypothetical protein